MLTTSCPLLTLTLFTALSALAVEGQKVANSYGQKLHSDFLGSPSRRAQEEASFLRGFRSLQDCSGGPPDGTVWGPDIGPPPEGCENNDGGGTNDGRGLGGEATSSEVSSVKLKGCRGRVKHPNYGPRITHTKRRTVSARLPLGHAQLTAPRTPAPCSPLTGVTPPPLANFREV